jgi:hypothetical protein
MSSLADFQASVADPKPPAGLSVPLTALWWSAKGHWDRAHKLVQDDGGKDAAWVHAYLHRVEGDLANAGYWYRRAGRDRCDADLTAEWAEIAATLLVNAR